MKKTSLFLISLIFILASCSDNKLSVTGKIDGKYNGKTAYLYIFEDRQFSDFKLLATTKVESGAFSFDDLGDKPELKDDALPMIAYISLFDINMTEDELTEDNAESPMATVILEKGAVKVEFEKSSVSVSGTPKNEHFNKMHAAIKDFVEFTSGLSSLEDLDVIPVNDEGKDGRAQLEALDLALKNQSYVFIKENMQNSVGEYLLLQSGSDMFTPKQILELIEMGTAEFREREEIKELHRVLSEMSLGKTDDLEELN